MFEEEEKITFKEFKAWLVGLIRGKRGAIPDLQDWKQIKKMMDKVQEAEPTVIKRNDPVPCYPLQPHPWENPYWNPELDPVWGDSTVPTLWCSSSDTTGQSYNGITMTSGNSNMLPITEKTYSLDDMYNGGESEKPTTAGIKPNVEVLAHDETFYSDAIRNIGVEGMLEIINDWID
jgi:hypothetical protein